MNRGWSEATVAAALAPLGRALLDHHERRRRGVLTVRFDTGEEDARSAADFFRADDDLEPVDRAALTAALDGGRGRILDVGAGAGAMALPLQRAGRRVTALEILSEAATVLRQRGVEDVREEDLWTFRPACGFATVLALMNGSGLAGTLGRLPALLERLAGFMAPGGRVLLDSTDLRGADGTDEGEDGRYVGEVHMQLAYGDMVGTPFPHLFVDPDRLEAAAASVGLRCRVLADQPDGRYLAELTEARRR